ncbi:MAG: exo-beta-N-acetylmuramidase NamZ domain-containing protein [Bdellovibrionales bacterium]
MFQLGIERLLTEKELQHKLINKRIAFLGHPASVTQDLQHSMDALMGIPSLKVVVGFGPQHGMRGEKQDNMIESDDYTDPFHNIPVYSLYGRVRRPTPEMLKGWDVLLVDLQDVGCRIYTFLTTLFYMLEAVHNSSQEVWVLDRPNPAGREIEGHKLDMRFESFVGAAPIPMRHGLTLGEAALWYRDFKKLKVNLTVIGMNEYHPAQGPLFGWPQQMSWVNPSPNIPRLTCTRTYPGTVLIEGTNLSEGRGTTIPLEIFGAPDLNIPRIVKDMRELAPQWLRGCRLRPASFEPTFHKFRGQLVSALQVHVDGPFHDPAQFRPYRLVNLFFKSVHRIHPEWNLWRQPPYEYEQTLLPIDILSGHDKLRAWVANANPDVHVWDESLREDEMNWERERREYLLY